MLVRRQARIGEELDLFLVNAAVAKASAYDNFHIGIRDCLNVVGNVDVR